MQLYNICNYLNAPDKSKYPKSCFLYSFFQHRAVDKSIFLFSIDGFRVQRKSNPDYKDIRFCATTLQFQAFLVD